MNEELETAYAVIAELKEELAQANKARDAAIFDRDMARIKAIPALEEGVPYRVVRVHDEYTWTKEAQ